MSSAGLRVIDNKRGLGEIGISRPAIVAIVEKALRDVEGIALVGESTRTAIKSAKYPKASALLSAPGSISATFQGDGFLKITIKLAVLDGYSPAKTVLKVEEAVVNALTLALESENIIVSVKLKGAPHGKSKRR